MVILTALLGAVSPMVMAQQDQGLAQGRTVRAVCSAAPEWCQLAASEFQRLTGVRVEQTLLSTREALLQLRAEATKPRIDLWWGGTGAAFFEAAELGLLEPYRPIYLNDLHSWSVRQFAMTHDRVGGLYTSAIGLGWNSELLKKKKIPEPKCWSDLSKPAYRGAIVMPDPAMSGSGYLMLAGLVQLMGEEPAFEYLKRLHANVARYTPRSVQLAAKVAQGEVPIGIGFLFGFEEWRQKGAPVRTVAPCESTSYEVGGIALIRGRPHADNGKQFYDWLMGPQGQASAARAGSLQVPANKMYRSDTRIPTLDGVSLIKYDFETYGKVAERQRLVERWMREVAIPPR